MVRRDEIGIPVAEGDWPQLGGGTTDPLDG